MKKIGTFISDVDNIIKHAFVPAPQQTDPQVQQMVQQLPPEVQQQVMQQLQQLPPEQQGQAMQQVMQQMQQGGQQQGGQPQDPQQAGQAQPQQGGQPQDQQQAPAGEEPLPPGHLQAENDLDNTKVQLSVRELMDLTSGGKATQSHLKVKQLVDSHNQKMQQAKQQAEQDAIKQQAEQQVAAQGMQSGGLYSQAPDMSGKSQTPTN